MLTGTALASTLLLGTLVAPTPAQAVVTCDLDPPDVPASPGRIDLSGTIDSIDCLNTEVRFNAAGSTISLGTSGNGNGIYLDNSGTLTATNVGSAFGIGAGSVGDDSPVDIVNSGDIMVTSTGGCAFGFAVGSNGANSDIGIVNSGAVVANAASDAFGIRAARFTADSSIDITNSGNVTAISTGGYAFGIFGYSYASDSPIVINNSGPVEAATLSPATDARGIYARTNGANSSVTVTNSGDVVTSSPFSAYGIYVRAYGANSNVTIHNTGHVSPTGLISIGILGRTFELNTSLSLDNRGEVTSTGTLFAAGIGGTIHERGASLSLKNRSDVTVTSEATAFAIFAAGLEADSSLTIENRGNVTATGPANATGIRAYANSQSSSISIDNRGKITATSVMAATAISIETGGADSSISVDNSGDLIVTSDDFAYGIYTTTLSAGSATDIRNSGDITALATGGDRSRGIFATSGAANSAISIVNSGGISAAAAGGYRSSGIVGASAGANSAVDIGNSGDIVVTNSGPLDAGITAFAQGDGSSASIDNSGDVAVTGQMVAFGLRTFNYSDNSFSTITNRGNVTVSAATDATALYSFTLGNGSSANVNNSGDLTVTGASNDNRLYGIFAGALGDSGAVNIVNSGDIAVSGAVGVGYYAYGIVVIAPSGSVRIENSGSIRAEGSMVDGGLYVNSGRGTTVVNTGEISTKSLRAINVAGYGTAKIYNAGTITGFVDLTEQDDMFVNQSGGLFDARLTSEFRGGNDLFTNEDGGTVRALNVGGIGTRFEGLERFENRGTISMVDGAEGDSFTIANDGGTLNFAASGSSRLAVDAFLGEPGSTSDTFTIEGDVSGRTEVTVHNTNPGPGAFNSQGIPVVFAMGETPNADAFFLQQPIDRGFFDYDLFFEPTGSGQWELRSFAGGGAHLLPQLLTAAQDIWHQGSSTWFDRTADLRVLMAGGAAPTAYDPSGGKSLEAPGPYPLMPAVWARGSGGWLDRDDTARTRAFGRGYSFDLDRELETIDFQVGVDMGSYDVLGQGDALVFGVLGGFVHGDLGYEAIARSFNFDGGQVGAYATYLNAGLFVDTLLNAHIYSLETGANLGFPDSLDANTVGLRTDAGYRFGSFTGGAFLEPLATIEVMWANIDGFSLGGNTVSFNDEANVRGRLGLRAGTTMQAWEGTLVEPFVIGSLWSNLSDNNSATLVSTGRTFRFNDDLEDVWGEISAGVNFFNFSQTTAVFAKVDVTVGDDISGVGGKAGMRVNW